MQPAGNANDVVNYFEECARDHLPISQSNVVVVREVHKADLLKRTAEVVACLLGLIVITLCVMMVRYSFAKCRLFDECFAHDRHTQYLPYLPS